MKRLLRTFVLALGFLIATEVHADPIPCFGGWFVVPFVNGPAVCGDASVSGVDLNGVSIGSTVNPTSHDLKVAGALVGVVGTGEAPSDRRRRAVATPI